MKGIHETEIVARNRDLLFEETNAGLMGGAHFVRKKCRAPGRTMPATGFGKVILKFAA